MRSRRQALQLLAGVGASALAGCSGIAGPPDDVPTRTETETESAPPDVSTPPGTIESTRLVAEDREVGDEFGHDVALARGGSVAIVGAPGHGSTTGSVGGKALLFGHAEGAWHHRATLEASDGDEEDEFGFDVDLDESGETAVVGAPGDRDVAGEDVGSAYVFARVDGTWREQTKLSPSARSTNVEVGAEVAISASGTTVAVGAPNPFRDHAGEVFPFTSADGTWTEHARLAPADDRNWVEFGGALAFAKDGALVMVGAAGGRDFGNRVGTAFVYERADGAYRQTAAVKQDDGDARDAFGVDLDLTPDGSVAVVGAPNQEGSGYDSGAAYVLQRDGSDWHQQGVVRASDGDSGDIFGEAVAIDDAGETLVVGAPGDEDPRGPNAGTGYRFVRSGGAWEQTAKLRPETRTISEAGTSAAVGPEGAPALLGAPGAEDQEGDDTGTVYVFE